MVSSYISGGTNNNDWYYRRYGSADTARRRTGRSGTSTGGGTVNRYPNALAGTSAAVRQREGAGPASRTVRRGSTTYGYIPGNAELNAAIAAYRQQQQAGQYSPLAGPAQIFGGPASPYQTALVPGQTPQHQPGDPLYRDGDEIQPGKWGTERITQLQKQMVKAGLLQNSFVLGVWDSASKEAYKELLLISNTNNGQTYRQTLGQLIASAPDRLSSYFRKPQFLKPSRDRMLNDVDDAFLRRLGRTPTANERKDLADYYAKQFRREYRLETVPQAREQFMGSAIQNVNPAEIVAAGGDPYAAAGFDKQPQDAREIDPGESVEAEFSRRYRNEEDMLVRRKQQEEQQINVTSAFNNLRSMMGQAGVQQLG